MAVGFPDWRVPIRPEKPFWGAGQNVALYYNATVLAAGANATFTVVIPMGAMVNGGWRTAEPVPVLAPWIRIAYTVTGVDQTYFKHLTVTGIFNSV